LEEKIEVLIREEDDLEIILTKKKFGKNKLIFLKKRREKEDNSISCQKNCTKQS